MDIQEQNTILEELIAKEPSYRPSEEAVTSLRDKILIMVVGPVAVGKSFVIERTMKTDPDFQQVSVFTTRERRADDDPKLFKIHPHTTETVRKIRSEIEQGELINYTIHPTTRCIYGTKPEDYTARYNLLPILSGAVAAYTDIPFEQKYIVFVVARPEIWKMWLDTRYPGKSEERTKRIKEAIISLKWGLSQNNMDIVWLENSPQTPEKTVEDLMNIVKYKRQSDVEARIYAEQMLEFAINEEGV